MLQKHKRMALGIGVAVGTAGLVTAIAVPLALKNKDEDNNQAVVIDKAAHAQVYTDAQALVATATGNGTANTTVEKVSTKSNGDTIIEGAITAAATRATGTSTPAIKFVLTLDKDGLVLSYTENGADKTTVVKAHQAAITGKFTDVKNSIKESKLIEVTKTATQLEALINKQTGAITSVTGLEITATNKPTLTPGTAVTWTFSVTAKDGYKLGTTPTTFTVAIIAPATTTTPVTPPVVTPTFDKTAHPMTAMTTTTLVGPAQDAAKQLQNAAKTKYDSATTLDQVNAANADMAAANKALADADALPVWTDNDLLATVTTDQVKAAINAILTAKSGDAPTSLPSNIATVTVKAAKVGSTTNNAASKDLSISLTYVSTDNNAGSITVSFNNGASQNVVISGWTVHDADIQAMKDMSPAPTAALKTTVTAATTKASTIVPANFDITATLAGATFEVIVGTSDDSKGEVTYHIKGTNNGKTFDFPSVTLNGFLTTKQELTNSLTALTIDNTSVTVANKARLASAVQDADIVLPTLTGFTFAQTHTATDATGILSVTVVGTSTADSTVTRTETVSVTGFHKLLADPTSAVASLAAAADGTSVTVTDADATDHMTAVVKGAISAGAPTATITVSAEGIYVFAGDTQTKDVSSVTVDQTAYTAAQAAQALADARTAAKAALNGVTKPTAVDLAAHSQTTFDAIGTTLTTQLGLVDAAATVGAVEAIAKGTTGTGIDALTAAITAYNSSTGTDAADAAAVATEKTAVEGETFTALAATAAGNLDQSELKALGLTEATGFAYTGVLSGAAGSWALVITITKGSASADTSSITVNDATA